MKRNERYRQLFERNLAGLYRSTADGRILDCNETFAKMYGYASCEEVLAVDADELYFSAFLYGSAVYNSTNDALYVTPWQY